MWRHAILLIFLLLPLRSAEAQVIELRAGRPFGYFIGDEIVLESVVRWDERFILVDASVPRPGPVTYWLDIKAVNVIRVAAGHYRLRLLYQTFFAPLGAQSVEIPGYTLAASNAQERVEARVPPWRFLMSPLRGVDPQGRGDGVAIRADIASPSISLAPAVLSLASFAGVALLAALLAAYHWARWPFRLRVGRPFTEACKAIGGGDYLNGLLRLHRAFDESAGHRLLAADVEQFLRRRPSFRPMSADIGEFFRASGRAFFGVDPEGAMDAFPSARLRALVEQLADAERGA